MLSEHLGYLADPIRLERYETAVAQVIKPGDRVVDLGCGTGILGLLCLKAGAGHVIAIDSTAMLEVARATYARADLANRASFIRGKAHQVEVPERVDVVICDQVGYFGFGYGIVQSLQDARLRFLKPGGKLIPRRIALQLALVESERCAALSDDWRAPGVPAEFNWLRELAINNEHPVELKRDELLSGPAELGEIDLGAANPEFFSWATHLRAERDGIVHGLGGWFESELADGIWMTNSPLSDHAIKRSQIFFPLGEAVAVKAGDKLKATVMARPNDNQIAWTAEFAATGRKFSHSTWLGELLTPQEIHQRSPEHVPRPNSIGSARAIVFGYCDGKRTARQIEEAVLREHPHLFPSASEICRFVAQVLGADTE